LQLNLLLNKAKPGARPGLNEERKNGRQPMEAGRILHALLQDETGVTAIEYALLGSLIAMAIVTSVTLLGGSLKELYEMVAGKVLDAIS
jgi:pilus assembly protein Flp/PilA